MGQERVPCMGSIAVRRGQREKKTRRAGGTLGKAQAPSSPPPPPSFSPLFLFFLLFLGGRLDSREVLEPVEVVRLDVVLDVSLKLSFVGDYSVAELALAALARVPERLEPEVGHVAADMCVQVAWRRHFGCRLPSQHRSATGAEKTPAPQHMDNGKRWKVVEGDGRGWKGMGSGSQSRSQSGRKGGRKREPASTFLRELAVTDRAVERLLAGVDSGMDLKLALR